MRAKQSRTKKSLFIAVLLLALMLCSSASAITQEQVRLRDQLWCGVSPDLAGFSKADSEGNWSGLNVDICRAVAAAVLGDDTKVKFIPLSEKDGIGALLTGEVDLLSMNLGWSLRYDTSIGIHFCGVTFYDGIGFMVPVKRGVQSALELDNSVICSDPGRPDQGRLAAFFNSHGLSFKREVTENTSQLLEIFESGRCDVISADTSHLAMLRTLFAQPEEYRILPETISRRTLGPAVRQGDDGWFNIVRWTLFMLKIAEMEGLTSANAEDMKAAADADMQTVLGIRGNIGKGLGLANDWVVRMISAVGNYGEMFSRNLGSESDIKMDRNLNELWNRGGLHYAPPID
jgi:general L-amino acid transport system substrate-binding protein